MRNKKSFGIALLVLGLILLIASLAADAIGLGGSSNFGWKQIVGSIAGAVAAAAGFVLYSRK